MLDVDKLGLTFMSQTEDVTGVAAVRLPPDRGRPTNNFRVCRRKYVGRQKRFTWSQISTEILLTVETIAGR